jgi:hypothetical protein
MLNIFNLYMLYYINMFRINSVLKLRDNQPGVGNSVASTLTRLVSERACGFNAIDISGCTSGIGYLAKQIIELNLDSLVFLNLSSNDLRDTIRPIFEVLKKAPNLQILDIVDNNTGFWEAEPLGELLKSNANLSAVFFGAKRSMGNRQLHTSPPKDGRTVGYHDAAWPQDYSTGFNEVALGEARAIFAGVKARKIQGNPLSYFYFCSKQRGLAYLEKSEFYKSYGVSLCPSYYHTDNVWASCDLFGAQELYPFFTADYEQKMQTYEQLYTYLATLGNTHI